ncbi:MAG: SEC-C domain-containing protein [Chloroflexi bacterium]|nr:SEC-C domain-containing protein [Chloroflexota bacterium]
MTRPDQAAVPRTWRKPPFIANPLLRYGLWLVVIVYLVWAFGSLPFNWARISEGLPRAARIFGGGFPPSFERSGLLITGFKESFQIAILATLMGVALSIPFAVMAAKNVAPKPIYLLGRAVIIVSRSFHPVIVAILFVAAVGFGPLAGILTLTIYSIGFVGKLLAEEIEEMHEQQRPVLVGTVSIEKSEYLSELLKRHGVTHQVLNAKFHEKEAGIIADAGRPGAVTIATNMAGRGTDIVLGGKPDGKRSKEEWQREHDQVVEAGGLHIIGTERHEARRIDNQLRGRAGRQGDPGSSRFFVSLEDDVMRRFAPDWLGNMLGKLGMDEDTPLESKMVSKSIESAQTKVEGHNFDIRKHLVDYDDVMNTHRDVIYKERAKIFAEANLKSNILEMVHEEITDLVELHVPERDEDLRNLETLLADVGAIMKLPSSVNVRTFEELDYDEILERLLTVAEEEYERREVEIGPEQMRTLERLLMLRTIDGLWVEHLTATDEMRQGIGLRAYGQADPLVAYKREAHDMWGQLLVNIRHQVARAIYHVELSQRPPQRAPVTAGAREPAAVAAGAGGGRSAGTGKARKIGRNQPCPCGSGKKYKKCHGMAA